MWLDKYRRWGISFFPLKERDKRPAIASWAEYQRRHPTDAEINEWKSEGVTNYGAVCGEISGDLVVVDVDKEELFSKLNLGEIASSTFTVKTAKGYHIYLRCKVKSKSLKWKDKEEIRIQSDRKYVVMAGSIHPVGCIYEHFLSSPLEIKSVRDPEGLFEEIERRWKKYHGIDKIEEVKEVVKWKSGRSRGIEAFKEKIDIGKVISTYVAKEHEFGSYWQGKCPFHNDRYPSFTVYEDTKNWYCFGCEQYGDVISFIQRIEKCDFISAIKKIEEVTGVEYFWRKGKEEEIEEKKLRPSDIEEIIMDNNRFITLKDTEEILYYKEGCWCFKGEVYIKELAERIMKDLGRKENISAHFVNEVIGHVQRETYKDRQILNREQRKINLLNGVFDLKSSKLLPLSPEYYFTYRLPVNYEENEDGSEIMRFLRDVLHEDDIEAVLEFIAYCLVPEQRFHKAMMFVGDGANGKSTLIELVRQFLGEENTTSHSLQTLLTNRFAVSDLYGKLVNLYADLPSEALKETGMFKILTGGDMLQAEKKFKPTFQFSNTAKLIFSANVLPYTFDDSGAFFRRWFLINFPNTFEGEKRDPYILKRLITEKGLSGFLNLLIPRLIRVLEYGFSKSKSTEELRDEYIMKSSPVQYFVKECIEEDPAAFETKDEVYSVFCQFCHTMKLPTQDKSVFGRRLPRYVLVKSIKKTILGRRVNCWEGIILKKEEESEL